MKASPIKCAFWTSRLRLALAAGLMVAVGTRNQAYANGNPLNGSSPRPFYVVAHNPNTVAAAQSALAAGANALEPDVTYCYCGNDPLGNLVDWDSSSPNRNGHCDDTKFVDWLDGAHNLALQYPNQLALIIFDVKSSAATAAFGSVILNAIRTHLNTGGVNVNVIISVATLDDVAVFDNILGMLGPQEGVQVDEDDDVGAVGNYFFSQGYFGNICYGDGTAGGGGNLPRAMDRAVGSRALSGFPKAVTYVYTIEHVTTMNSFIDSGVDGIIPDGFPPPTDFDPQYVTRLKGVVDGRSDIRMATRADNPFQQANEAYALKIITANNETLGGEGTDADLTFTLNGALGSASVTVNSGYFNTLLNTHRMEPGNTDWVTIASKNLGVLNSITIYNNGAGLADDWKLDSIKVYSGRWLYPQSSYNYNVAFDDWIDGDATRTLTLSPNFPAPQALADEYLWSASDWGYTDGSNRAPWKQFADAYNRVTSGGTIHVAAGQYSANMTLSKPCTIRFWGDHGNASGVIGNP